MEPKVWAVDRENGIARIDVEGIRISFIIDRGRIIEISRMRMDSGRMDGLDSLEISSKGRYKKTMEIAGGILREWARKRSRA